MEWGDLNVILAIGRAGSLAGAARTLELNHSTVFRRLNDIEQRLGVRLFERLPQGYVLTEAGEAAMRSAERIESEVHELTRDLNGRDLRLQGTVRITAPEGISIRLLAPLLAQFGKTHPYIRIELIVTGHTLQLAQREADLAVRVTAKPPDTSIGKRICEFRFAAYATPEYIKSVEGVTPDAYQWLMTEDSRDWFAASVWKKFLPPEIQIKFMSNSTLAVVNMVREGLGVAVLPCFLGDNESGLVRMLEPRDDMSLDLWLLIHPDLRHTARVKVLMQYLYENLTQQKSLIEGISH
jgi:DNA-binding transcriptional LysR family regulator